jgi:hypothetical protein
MDIVLTRAAVADARRTLPFLVGVLANHDFPLDRGRLQIIDDKAAFSPGKPFLLLGQPGEPLAESPVRFDRGALRVVDAKQRLRLAVEQLPGLSVAQVVRHKGQHGLWLMPAADGRLTPGAEIYLDQDDVAFADERGIVMTMDSRASNVARIEYPEYRSWLDSLERHRFWLIALGWTVLVVLLIQLYRKTRAHRDLR